MRFEELHWTESDIESVRAQDRQISIVASDVFILGSAGARRLKVTFEGVASARREVTEYIGNPKSPDGFKTGYVIQELEPIELPNTNIYGLEGTSTFAPVSWLDIEVRAQSVLVEEI